MRGVRRGIGVIVLALALPIFGVSSASAAQFTASALGTLGGSAIEDQVFAVNGGTITCKVAKVEGEIVSTASAEQEMTLNYGSCTAFGLAVVDTTRFTVLRTASGQTHIKEPFTITVTGGLLGNCTVKFPAQTVGTEAYANIGVNDLEVTPNIHGMTYITSGGLCGSSGANGLFHGQIEVFRVGGGVLRFDS